MLSDSPEYVINNSDHQRARITKLLLVLPSTSTKYTSVGPHAFGLAAIRQPVQPEALDFAKKDNLTLPDSPATT